MSIRDLDKLLLRAMAQRLRARAKEMLTEISAEDRPAELDDSAARAIQAIVAESLDEQANVYEDMAK